MCRDKEHGGQRCDADTSEARRKRRKASKARTSHVVHIPIIAGKVEPFEKPLSMEEIKAEAQDISSLLHSPCDPDPVKQDAIDAELEKRVTRLGLEIGNEVDRRANFNKEEAEREYLFFEYDNLKEKLEIVRAEMLEHMSEKREFEEAMTDKTEDSPEDRELKRITEKFDLSYAELKRLTAEVEAKKPGDYFVREDEVTATERRLAQASREILAEIRPVGGKLSFHAESNVAAARKVQDTVGKYYPSSWIETSENAGSMVINATFDRGSYQDKQRYASNNPEDVAPVDMVVFIEEENIGKVYAELVSDGDTDSVNIAGHPVLEGGKSYQALSYNERIPFDLSKDKTDAGGKPEGSEWKHGKILETDPSTGVKVSEEKHWYRIKKEPGKLIASINMTPASDLSSDTLAYHEFCHRVENTLGEKDSRGARLIERQEEAFLRRRTTQENGTREPLRKLIGADYFNPDLGRTSDFMIAYVGKEYTTSYNREVLPVGAEAAFGHGYGSFHGLGKKGKEDLDHRGFTLGIFATA
jgi:hypothetical protein